MPFSLFINAAPGPGPSPLREERRKSQGNPECPVEVGNLTDCWAAPASGADNRPRKTGMFLTEQLEAGWGFNKRIET